MLPFFLFLENNCFIDIVFLQFEDALFNSIFILGWATNRSCHVQMSDGSDQGYSKPTPANGKKYLLQNILLS